MLKYQLIQSTLASGITVLIRITLYSDFVLPSLQLAWVCIVTEAGWLDQMSQRGVGSQWEFFQQFVDLHFVLQQNHLNSLDPFHAKPGVWDLHSEQSVLQFY